jgi:hypothetical protein
MEMEVGEEGVTEIFRGAPEGASSNVYTAVGGSENGPFPTEFKAATRMM